MKKPLVSLVFLLSGLCIYSQQKMSVADYIAKYQNMALREMKLYKIPASITLAQGLLESGNGNSELARNANNHFGIKCKAEWKGDKYYYDDDEKHECFRKYKSDTASYRDHSLFLTLREYYKTLFTLDICDYKGWAYGLKKAGYATEPLYAEMLIKLIEENLLYNFDCPDQIIKKDTAMITMVKPNEVRQVSVSDSGKNHGMKINPQTNNEDDFGDITLTGNSRKIFTNNGVKYIKARKKDSFEKIANDFSLTANDIMRYNDIKQKHAIQEGEMVYIEAKKKKAANEFHIVGVGETLHSIAQSYGVQVRELYAKNHLKPDSELKTGQKIWLKNSKPEK
jgi:LysM repeat protein